MLDRSVAELAIEEQGRIGRDLHDSVSQELSGVALIGDGVARRLEIAGTPEAERVRQMAAAVRHSLSVIRNITEGLILLELGEDGLDSAIRRMAGRLLERRRAESIALATVGVDGVTNSIVVRDSGRSDRAIRTDAEQALLSDPAADAYEVDVSVRDGIATLTGTVESYAEQQLAETVVAGVRGVTAINNKIEIAYAIDRPDSEIEADIVQRLANTVTVDDRLLDVSVSDGDVELSGTVGSALEKARAYSLAWVAGVESVSTGEVEIEWWARDTMRRTDLYQSTDDASVREAVEDAISYSPFVDPDNPVVTVENGVVTLTGIVDDLRAKKTAEDLAERTIGVWDVENYLRVSSPPSVSDEALEADLGTALLRDTYVDRFDITVSVVNGHAHLYGAVDTDFEKNRAESVAQTIEGVVDVSNYLTIEDDWDIEEDWEIAEDIRNELFWSPFVDSDDVSVVVVDSVATITGTVDTLSERSAAVENAYEGGARLVDNDILVDYGPDPLRP